MASESPRRACKGSGLLVRSQPASDKSVMESVVGFIQEVVPQAYSGTQSKAEDKEKVTWLKFEQADITDPKLNLCPGLGQTDSASPPLLLVIGYTNGVQVWCLVSTGDAHEVLSLRQGAVKSLKVLPTPESVFGIADQYADDRPLVAVCDSTSAGSPYYSVYFLSLRTGKQVKSIKFQNPVVDVHCNKRVIAISFKEKVAVFDACSFRDRFWITSCYPSQTTCTNPIALGTRWLAYADKRLVPMHQSCGGMTGDGSQTYAATVISAAKTITKGLTMFGETISNFTSSKSHSLPQSVELSDNLIPGVVTVVDTERVHGEVAVDEDSDVEGFIAHFQAHTNECIAAMEFDPSGALLLTACRLGHNFHVFRIMSHPHSCCQGAVHHLYTLRRGDTTATVQDISFTQDSRWVAVTTYRGTTHVFPITPYGGAVNVRTHTSPRVVNRASRFHKSAGLEEIEAVTQTSRSSSPAPGSHSSSPSGREQQVHPHYDMLHANLINNSMPNPRLPRYPHPVAIFPLAQIKQPLSLGSLAGTNSGISQTSQKKDGSPTSLIDPVHVTTQFALNHGWLRPSSASRDDRKCRNDSLFVCGSNGSLVEYVLEPKPQAGLQKVTEESPLDLSILPRCQWSLFRLHSTPDQRPPLNDNNPLLVGDTIAAANIRRRSSSTPLSHHGSHESVASDQGDDDQWVSQVEIVTYTGPHRRLWMGPQFCFKTVNQSPTTVTLNPDSSALFSHSPETQIIGVDVEDTDMQNVRIYPVRSNPVAMPLSGESRPQQTPSQVSLLQIEAASVIGGSLEQSPRTTLEYGSWTDYPTGPGPSSTDEDRLCERLADAMTESPSKEGLGKRSQRAKVTALDSAKCLDTSARTFDADPRAPRTMEHVLVFEQFPHSSSSSDSP